MVLSLFFKGKLGLKVSSGEDLDTSKIIKLLLVPPNSNQRFTPTAHESYQIQVNEGKENTITITGEWPSGVFYGVQTLLALMDDQGLVPTVSIKDSPRFSYRGLMLDVGRNFIPKHEILKLLDAMAMYKMNKFHFHLSENEGWRLEIPGLEELTQVRWHLLETSSGISRESSEAYGNCSENVTGRDKLCAGTSLTALTSMFVCLAILFISDTFILEAKMAFRRN